MLYSYKGISPKIANSAFIAESADVIGDVEIGEDSSIWYQVLVRGDVNIIRIGSRTNVQDLSCLHVTRKTAPLLIGNEVTIGHHVMLHGCKVGNLVLVGMGSVILDNAEIPDRSIIGAGSLITMDKKFPEGHLIMGSPAKAVRPLKPEELQFLPQSAENYVRDREDFLKHVKVIR